MKQEDRWSHSGEKIFISDVGESLEMGRIHLLLARANPDPAAEHRAFTFFAVPLRGTPGITPTYLRDMARVGISTGGFDLEDVEVPTQVGVEVMNKVADWFGAMAYTEECPVEMGIRPYSVGAEGTMNSMRLIMARELLGAEFLPYRHYNAEASTVAHRSMPQHSSGAGVGLPWA